MRSTGLSVRPVVRSEMAAAKLSIPICIYMWAISTKVNPKFDTVVITSPGPLSFRLNGALRRRVIVALNTLD
jgi:hypothetical protein